MKSHRINVIMIHFKDATSRTGIWNRSVSKGSEKWWTDPFKTKIETFKTKNTFKNFNGCEICDWNRKLLANESSRENENWQKLFQGNGLGRPHFLGTAECPMRPIFSFAPFSPQGVINALSRWHRLSHQIQGRNKSQNNNFKLLCKKNAPCQSPVHIHQA